MNSKHLFFSSVIALSFSLQLIAQSFEDKLSNIKDIRFEKINTPKGFTTAYKVFIKQAIDHNDPSKGFFEQKIWLSHSDVNQPVVMATEGYESDRNYIYEPSMLLKANQLDVEHRFFGESIPKGMDYKYLTIQQAVADYHHIREVFSALYSKDWIATGISKGGETTIYYRYFFPKDVKVSIPYVAPLQLELEDKRIYHFFDTVGTESDRKAILQVQKRVLAHRERSQKIIQKLIADDSLKFNYLTFDQAFEYAVLEYPFSFWQWNGKQELLPSKHASLKKIVKHMNAISSVAFFSDSQMKELGSHYYQSGTQFGYYGYETEDFEGLLPALTALYGRNVHPTAIFMPDKSMKMTFDPSLPNKVLQWATTQGNQIIYINGAIDPWGATAVPRPQNSAPDALWYFLAGKHHGQARIANMSAKEKEQLVNALERWLKVDIEF